jgi:hypothetical protein
MGTIVAAALLASALAAASPGPAISEPATQARGASLRFVSGSLLPVEIFQGLNAVDNQQLILAGRTSTRVAAGVRTVFYTCPNQPQPAGGARLSFDFQADRAYELVCRAGQPAEIRAADC